MVDKDLGFQIMDGWLGHAEAAVDGGGTIGEVVRG
jgi:hypothetical protein